MGTSELKESVASLVLKHPSWIPGFESLHIDYCCHGKATLEEACQARGIEPEVALEQLHVHDADLPRCQADVTTLRIDELVHHIVSVHHAYLRKQLPLLDDQLGRVLLKHGQRHPGVAEMKTLFHALREELESHMLKEELVLFPWAKRHGVPTPAGFNIAMPIHCMEREHEFAGQTLEKLRSLSNEYAVPQDACTTYTLLMGGLADLERDLHQHIHEENNILFPRLMSEQGTGPLPSSCLHPTSSPIGQANPRRS